MRGEIAIAVVAVGLGGIGSFAASAIASVVLLRVRYVAMAVKSFLSLAAKLVLKPEPLSVRVFKSQVTS